MPTTGRTPCCAGARAAIQPTSRAVYDTGGNYVVQGADVATSIRAMQALEFSVCHDLFLTTTARYCDVVLPATHWLERSDVVFTSANYLLFSHRVAAPPGQARDDYADLLRPRRGAWAAATPTRRAGTRTCGWTPSSRTPSTPTRRSSAHRYSLGRRPGARRAGGLRRRPRAGRRCATPSGRVGAQRGSLRRRGAERGPRRRACCPPTARCRCGLSHRSHASACIRSSPSSRGSATATTVRSGNSPRRRRRAAASRTACA